MSVSLTVMTFNLHEDQPDDSPNSWEKRRDLCVSVITSYSPMILCTQQGLQICFFLVDLVCACAFTENGRSGSVLFCVLEMGFHCFMMQLSLSTKMFHRYYRGAFEFMGFHLFRDIVELSFSVQMFDHLIDLLQDKVFGRIFNSTYFLEIDDLDVKFELFCLGF